MEQRKRVNASQAAKGEWKIEATVEVLDSNSVEAQAIAGMILDLVKETETAFLRDGRKLAGGAA
jgi:hypothetical protein